jgi:hypothetical protein
VALAPVYSSEISFQTKYKKKKEEEEEEEVSKVNFFLY